MAKSKTTKASSTTEEDLATLQSDVVSFASSLGLVSGVSSLSSGFDDSDFRKPPQPIKSDKSSDSKPVTKGSEENANLTPKTPEPRFPKKNRPKPLEVAPFESNGDGAQKGAELPLMKPSSLSGSWHVDADELEARVLGKEARGMQPRITGMEEMRKLVERKKELGERLMQQYTQEYQEAAKKKKSGDLRLLEATARSGTTADKVSAFACLIEDNPIANVRSLDALLCEY